MTGTAERKYAPIDYLATVLQTSGMILVKTGGYLEALKDAQNLGTFHELWEIKRAREEIFIASAALDAYAAITADKKLDV